MDRSDSIQYLDGYVEARRQYHDLSQQVSSLVAQIADLEQEPALEERQGIRRGLASFILLWVPASLLLSALLLVLRIAGPTVPPYDVGGVEALFIRIEQVFPFAAYHPALFHFMLCAALAAAPAAILPAVRVLRHDRTYQEKNRRAMDAYREGCARLPGLRRELREAEAARDAAQSRLQQLTAQGLLPPEHLAQAEDLLYYLRSGGAGTLEEAVDLWEADRAREERLEQGRRALQGMLAGMGASVPLPDFVREEDDV